MTTPVNLNKVRKAKARTKAKAIADQNAVRFGQTKSDKLRAATLNEKAARKLSEHKREDS